jgi:WD repeat-containing protein 6
MREDHNHAGKHIWSLTHHSDKLSSVIFTGGSDGAIIRRMSIVRDGSHSYARNETSFHDLFATLSYDISVPSSSGRPSNDSIKQYVFVSGDAVLATTNCGRVLKGTIGPTVQDLCQRPNIKWSLILHAAELRAFAVMGSSMTDQVVCVGSANGKVWMYIHDLQSIQLLTTISGRISNIFLDSSRSIEGEDTVVNILVFSSSSSTARLLQITRLPAEQKRPQILKSIELSLPSTFQPTAFAGLSHGRHLILGSRSGALAVYLDVFGDTKAANKATPAICMRHAHGSDTVTHIQQLPAITDNPQVSPCCNVLSTGRDGRYAIHRICFQREGAKSTSATLTTLHLSRPPFGPNIEGANVVKMSSGTMEVLLHGFHGKNFVVWNESSNREIINIPCGGAHRSWAYISHNSKCEQDMTKYGGCFVWTKAGVFNLAKFEKPAHEVIQPGGHGREIKAMAIHPEKLTHQAPSRRVARLVATGAEDTAIRLWMLTASEGRADSGTGSEAAQGTATCLRILRNHTTGIQHLAFCKDFLFSSAGFEELFIWKINVDVSGVGIGTVLQATLPKHETVSDLRITSFKVISAPYKQQADIAPKSEQFLTYTAYSNSMVRVFRYTNDNAWSPENRFQLLGEGFYNTTCLTQLCMLQGSIHMFLTASTNGAIALWPDIDHNLINQDAPATLSHIAEQFIHQNAILALRMVQLAPDIYLLLTGGDDNAFGLTLIVGSSSSTFEPLGSNNAQTLPRFGTLLLPGAHAAAVTALEILDMRNEAGPYILTVASTGNDQRVKIWRITVDMNELSNLNKDSSIDARKLGPEAVRAIGVQLLKEIWTSVADVSSMTAIPEDVDDIATAGEVDTEGPERSKGKRLMIAGVGMEIFQIDHAGDTLD